MLIVIFYCLQTLQDDTNLAVIGQLMMDTYYPDNANLLNIGSISCGH